jgi:hypothetical protein
LVRLDDFFYSSARLQYYLSFHGYDDISSVTENPYSWAHGMYGSNVYQVLSQFPARMRQFNIAMSTQDAVLPVVGIYDFNNAVSRARTSDPQLARPFIVDIGGGRGQALLQLRSAHPELQDGKMEMILQDKPPVLDLAGDLGPGIVKMSHDFFTTQTVKNAHLYYIRRCLHNWTDALVLKILKAIIPAMAKDSRLLIAEMVVPEAENESGGKEKNKDDGDMTVYWMDHVMMTFGGRERTRTDWERLLEEVGLTLVRVWDADVGTQAVLEAELMG